MNGIREQFPLLARMINGKPLIYFDNAATTPVSEKVLDAITNHYRQHAGNPHRSTHTLANESSQVVEDTRKKVLSFLGTTADRYAVIFTKNATEALNLAANIISELGGYHQVIATELEHHANFLPWLRLQQQQKVSLELVKLDRDGRLSEQSLLEKIARTPKSIVAITAGSNVTGQMTDLQTITETSQKNGCITVIDAAQSIAHERIQLDKTPVDFLAASAHKMYGPKGVGFLVMKREYLAAAKPLLVGGGIVEHVSASTYLLKKNEDKLEAGSADTAGIAGLGAAIDFIEGIGIELIKQKENSLREHLVEKLREISHLKLLQSDLVKHVTATVSFAHPMVHPHDIASELDTQGIAVRAGLHCAEPLHTALGIKGSVRVSLAFYNTNEEIDYFIDALNVCLRKFA